MRKKKKKRKNIKIVCKERNVFNVELFEIIKKIFMEKMLNF